MKKDIKTCDFIISLVIEESKKNNQSKYTSEHKKILCAVLKSKTMLLEKIHGDKK